MQRRPVVNQMVITAYTLALGAVGALSAHWLSMPVPVLTGPAIAISLAGLSGLRLAIADRLRDATFIVLGIGIGSGVTAEAASLILRLPVAFIALAVSLTASLALCWWVLHRAFGFESRAALLAASPGHLSFVLSMGALYNLDLTRIAVVQSVRLLALTLLTPFAALALGVDPDLVMVPTGAPLSLPHGAALVAAALALGMILQRLRVPAALLIAAMIVSSLGHVSDLTPGTLPASISVPAFVIIGTLIGTRFAGVTLGELRQSAVAGLAGTLITAGLSLVGALVVAALLGMSAPHVMVAFAPGGLETMVAMGAALGADPAFVAACHVGRLLLLSVLVPALYMRLPAS